MQGCCSLGGVVCCVCRYDDPKHRAKAPGLVLAFSAMCFLTSLAFTRVCLLSEAKVIRVAASLTPVACWCACLSVRTLDCRL